MMAMLAPVLPAYGYVPPMLSTPVQPRIEPIAMMARSAPARKKTVAKTAAKKAAPSGRQGLFAGSVAPTKAPKATKRSVSTKSVGTTYIDVTGAEYVEYATSLEKYDEIGVLPPLGRWDPLKIREQVCAATLRPPCWVSALLGSPPHARAPPPPPPPL